jgi:hypothetical protein
MVRFFEGNGDQLQCELRPNHVGFLRSKAMLTLHVPTAAETTTQASMRYTCTPPPTDYCCRLHRTNTNDLCESCI